MVKANCSKLIFYGMSIVNVITSLWLGINYVTYIEVLVLLVLLILRKISIVDFLLYSLFIPNKYLQLLCTLIYLIITRKIILRTLQKSEAIFIIYITLIGIMNCFVYNGLIISTLFQIGLYYSLLRLMDSFERDIEIKNVYEFLDAMFILQLITSLIEFLYFKSFGDCMTGTLISAHYFGAFLVIYVFVILKIIHPKVFRIGRLIRVILAILCLYLSDAKHVWVLFIFAAMIVKILKLMKIKNKITFSVLSMTIIIVLFVGISQTSTAKEILSKNRFINTYVYNTKYNKKMQFFSNTFEEMKGINGLIGFGVGQYGSQISITMSKGQIYDWNNNLNKYKYAIGPYSNAMNGLMTKEYSLVGIGMSSMIMGYPLVSFIGMLAELGIIGFIMLIRIFDKNYQKYNVEFLLAFIMMTLFDTYLEIPCVLILVLVATFINKNTNRVYL